MNPLQLSSADNRPARVRAAPARFDQEQAAQYEFAAAASLLSGFRRGDASFSDDESSADDDSSSSEDEEVEEKQVSLLEQEKRLWSEQWNEVHFRGFRAASPRVPVALDCNTPLDFFHLILPRSFLASIVQWTNTYTAAREEEEKENQQPQASAAAASSAEESSWQETTMEELLALLGCLVYMGIVCMDDTKDYWDKLGRQAFVADTFPRRRFLELSRMLRFSKEAETEEEKKDPLHFLRPLIAEITTNSLLYFTGGKWVSIDEAMVAFKGRSKMRQHIAKKRSPTGFKVWMLIDCDTNYVLFFDIYPGKGMEKEEHASANVVLNLVSKGLKGKWHRIAMDGFFTSYYLLTKLLEKEQYAVGTTRHNRKQFPKRTLLPEAQGIERGEWKFRQSTETPEIAVVSWMDKKPVNLISSCCNPLKETHIPRHKGRETFDVKCPEVVPLYTKYLRGVDVFSQRQSYNKIGRKARKFFYSLAWFLIDIAIHNAYILYQKKHNKHNFDEKDFRRELMQQLVNGFTCRQKAGAPHRRPRRGGFHRVGHGDASLTCHGCRRFVGEGKNNKKSRWSCEDCGVHLCMPDCYNKHIQSLSVEQEADSEEEQEE